MSRASLQRRLFAGALVWIVAALAVTGLVLSLLFQEHLEDELARRLDADFLQLVSQLSIAANNTVEHGRQMSDPLYQRAFSGRYWQVEPADTSTTQPLLRSRSLWEKRLTTAKAGNGDRLQRITGPRGQLLLALTRTITLPRRDAPIRVTVAANLQPVATAVAAFRGTLAIALGVLALGLIAASALQVWLGLRPLRRLRQELAAIRGARADRLAGAYPGEVAPLVADLNTVLADNNALIERARHRAGNLAHALKTPLSVIANEADRLARTGDSRRASYLQGEVEAMQRQIEWYLAHARIAAARRVGRATAVVTVIARLQRTLQRLHGEAGLIIKVDCAEDLCFAGETQDLEQMVGNLMDNACKWARGNVEVTAALDTAQLLIEVDDDGPGLDAEQRSRSVARGQRFDETTPGSGLGLAIVADLALAYEGELVLAPAALGGLSARLALPAIAHTAGERI